MRNSVAEHPNDEIRIEISRLKKTDPSATATRTISEKIQFLSCENAGLFRLVIIAQSFYELALTVIQRPRCDLDAVRINQWMIKVLSDK